MPLILLMMEPSRLRSVEEVVAVAERYAPHATHWVYDTSREPRLRSLPSAANVRSAQNGHDDGLRLSEEVGRSAEESDKSAPLCEGGESQASILSSQELASLKHPDQAGDFEA
jgi:hypothetical protein